MKSYHYLLIALIIWGAFILASFFVAGCSSRQHLQRFARIQDAASDGSAWSACIASAYESTTAKYISGCEVAAVAFSFDCCFSDRRLCERGVTKAEFERTLDRLKLPWSKHAAISFTQAKVGLNFGLWITEHHGQPVVVFGFENDARQLWLMNPLIKAEHVTDREGKPRHIVSPQKYLAPHRALRGQMWYHIRHSVAPGTKTKSVDGMETTSDGMKSAQRPGLRTPIVRKPQQNGEIRWK